MIATKRPPLQFPRFPHQLEPDPRLERGVIDDAEPYLAFAAADRALHADAVRRPVFRQGRFNQVDFSGSSLIAPDLTDIQFERCNLANARWDGLDGRRIELIGCRLTGFSATDARIEHLIARDCIIELANFRFAIFKSARFEHCQMAEADFLGADLSGAVFLACDLSRAELTKANLIDADLRGSDLDGARLADTELHGAQVDFKQAIAIAEYLGLKVDLG